MPFPAILLVETTYILCETFSICITFCFQRLEEFMSVHQETLSYFKTLLQYPKASSVKQENLIKYMAINIFSIQLLVDKNPGKSILRIFMALPSEFYHALIVESLKSESPKYKLVGF